MFLRMNTFFQISGGLGGQDKIKIILIYKSLNMNCL